MMMKNKPLKIRDGNGKLVKVDALIDRIFNANCSGIQIPILSIPKIFDAGRRAAEALGNVDAIRDAVLASVNAVRVN